MPNPHLPLIRHALSAAGAIAVLLLATSASSFAQGSAKPDGANAASADAPDIATSTLDAELFYQLMLGELNVFSGEAGAGFSLILDAARKTTDSKLFERAISVALQGRSGESALQAARAWRQALPASREANRYVLQILIGLNRLGEAQEPLKRDIATIDPKDRANAILAAPRFFARAADKKLAATTVEQALADYLANPTLGAQAWTAVGRMRGDAGDTAGLLEAARQAQAIDPAYEGAAILALNLVRPKTPIAEQIVRKYLEGKPLTDVRMAYARALLDGQRYADAMAQLKLVIDERPDHDSAWLILGSLELQDKKPLLAEKSFLRHIELAAQPGRSASPEMSRGLAQAHLSLAQIAEQKGDLTAAEKWLAKIENANEMVSAQSRRAAILARQGKLEEGRKLLRSLPEKTPSDARMKIMAEVQLLRDNKQYKAAYDFLAEKTKSGPPDYELLYDQAMLADKIGQSAEMERLLRQIIAGKPDYQHAYNALGYSLAERNLRLPEAKTLILKALEFAPDDPFITDSLGWVEFRSGNTTEALRILQTAFTARPDAEIAAHLGEVLWVSGQRDQALAVWREGYALNAENETLQETLKRLRVKL